MKISELKTFVANLFAALFFHRVMKIINVQSQTVNILFAFVFVCVREWWKKFVMRQTATWTLNSQPAIQPVITEDKRKLYLSISWLSCVLYLSVLLVTSWCVPSNRHRSCYGIQIQLTARFDPHFVCTTQFRLTFQIGQLNCSCNANNNPHPTISL